jgi:hypothetical protein
MEDTMDTIDIARQLMELAAEGALPKTAMANLLEPAARWTFVEACSQIEKDFTMRCAAKGDFCLASGCALEGDACLDALIQAGPEFYRACARAWLPLFSQPANRAEDWNVRIVGMAAT